LMLWLNLEKPLLIMQFFKQNPFVRYFVFAFVGIFAASYLAISSVGIGVCCGILLLLVLGYVSIVLNKSLFSVYRFRWLPGVIMIPAMTLMFALYYNLRQTTVVNTQGNFKLYGYVDDVLTSKESSAQFVVEVYYLENDSCRIDGPMKALVNVKIAPDSVGNLIGKRIEGAGFLLELQKPRFPYQFDYGKYLQQNGYACQFFLSQFSVSGYSKRTGFWDEPFLWLRQHFRFRFALALNDRSLQGVVQALIIGDRSQLDNSIRDAYVRAGAIHILAVSGMHVGILYLAVAWLLAFMRHRKVEYTFCCLFILWFYAGLTGNPPSVLRATIMFSVILIGEQSSRKTTIYNLLAFSAFVIAVINPNHLFNAGFWLSHLAVLGIGMFYKRINSFFAFNFILFKWAWSVVAVSVAAQIFTLPIMLLLFNGFSVYFILSNLLVLPLVSIILLGALLLAIVPSGSFVFQMFAGVVADLVRFINDCVGWVASLPGAYLNAVSFTIWEVIIYFFIVIALVVAAERKRVKLYWISIAASTALFVSLSCRLYLASSNYSVFALVNPKAGFVNVNYGRNCFLFVSAINATTSANMNLSGVWGRNFVKPIVVVLNDSLYGGHFHMNDGIVETFVCYSMDDLLNHPLDLSDKCVLRVCLEPGKEMACLWNKSSPKVQLHLWGRYARSLISNVVSEKYFPNGYEISPIADGYCSLPEVCSVP
jgi:competence protein ComEC